ncbi:hypothetical protein LCGC14_1860900 [marine sediment metagenome]|uniref:HNH nuclease domain-containing protein n=1 Tax=marine sediment metagenome TaxID=412755 RepID=A0A0F9IM25_9ZZZZ
MVEVFFHIHQIDKLRNKIRKRDNYICQNCGYHTDKRMLDIHHYDHNHQNNKCNNLRVLCVWCHMRCHRLKEKYILPVIITFEEIIKYDLDDDLFPVNKGFDFHLNYAFTRNLTTLFETINNSRLINENHVNFAFNLYPLLENANKAIVENVVFSSELVKDELEINFQNLYFQYQVDLGHYYFDNDVTHSFKDALTTQNQILNNMIIKYGAILTNHCEF